MILTETDEEGRIIAYVEYYIVNKDGIPKDDGLYCYVRDAWVWRGERNGNILKKFVEEGLKKYPQVVYIYYEQEKRPDRGLIIHEIKKMKEK